MTVESWTSIGVLRTCYSFLLPHPFVAQTSTMEAKVAPPVSSLPSAHHNMTCPFPLCSTTDVGAHKISWHFAEYISERLVVARRSAAVQDNLYTFGDIINAWQEKHRLVGQIWIAGLDTASTKTPVFPPPLSIGTTCRLDLGDSRRKRTMCCTRIVEGCQERSFNLSLLLPLVSKLR